MNSRPQLQESTALAMPMASDSGVASSAEL
jgi:hypothetical protein